MLSIATDFVEDSGSPELALRQIAAAGFAHIHWGHQQNSDFLYGPAELLAIELWLRELGLKVNDIHASQGLEKNCGSLLEFERLAGVELVKNRVDMAARLACDVVVMHAPIGPLSDSFRRSLDFFMPYCSERSVRIALENLEVDNFDALEQVFSEYPPEFIGLCYDPGHGNIAGNGLERLERVKSRLVATHLNDNDGTADQHRPLFSGTVDWPRLAGIIARSGYSKPAMTMELVLKDSGFTGETAFLQHAHRTGARFAELVRGYFAQGASLLSASGTSAIKR